MAAMIVESFAVLLAVLTSPANATVTLLTSGVGAVLATLTVSVMGG